MKCRWNGLLLAAAVAISSFTACKAVDSATRETAGSRQDEQVPESLGQLAQRLRTELEAKGYEVAQGGWKLFTIADCKYAIASIGNCYANNPIAPYVFPTLPLWPDEYVDETMRGAFGPLPGETWATYRFDPREAVVVLALLPPPAKYFGIQTYVYSRQGPTLDPADPMRASVPPELHHILFSAAPNPERALVFSSMGNSNNDVLIAESSGSAWEQERFVVITPDAAMEREMTEALLRAGVSDRNQVFTEPVSTAVARIGLGAEADDFMTLIRYAQPEDEAAGDQWRRQLPLVVLRVRPADKARPVEPYPKPAYSERTASSELQLESDLAALVDAVKQRWKQPEAPSKRFFSAFSRLELVGQQCLERPMNCLAETQDTDTYRISSSQSLDAGQVIAVVGTLGTATGNATDTNLAVNRFEVLTGVANVNDTDLQGTASGFEVGSADQLYVYYLARDCAGLRDCLELPTSLVPSGETIKVIQRNYIKPGTQRGADPTKLLDPWTIVFDGSARPAR